MPPVTNREITFLNDLKPYKTTWKVEVKVLHLWEQHSNCPGGDTLEFILEDKMVLFNDHDKEYNDSEDFSTCSSKRKERDADLNDMNSTSKKLCAKNIKTEKTND
ncbi:unnamed protein product [Brassica rapa]|uniref:Replication protein A 70 kDa DNA-binding subunit B/D first OB fold domain-containing protein n=1 Tax=Brassica campestris TaxID=3711 RepID=A0A8D9LQT8_BRACM|nr:unnamed protein product [Brassica rapa]